MMKITSIPASAFNRHRGFNKHGGFTLIEVMIVVAIISILAAIAFPSYQQYALESRRAEGTGDLTRLMEMQERYYTNQFPPTYTTTLTNLGFAADPYITESAYYSISAASCGAGIASCIALTATAQNEQDADGNLTLDSLGTKQRENVVEGTWFDDWN